MGDAKLTWGKTPRDLPERWPKTTDGAPEKPVLLTHLSERNYEVELLDELLRAHGIPALKSRGNYGALGKIVSGFSGEGVDIFVPAPMLEDARILLLPADDAEQTAADE